MLYSITPCTLSGLHARRKYTEKLVRDLMGDPESPILHHTARLERLWASESSQVTAAAEAADTSLQTNTDKRVSSETLTHTNESPRPPLPPFGLLLLRLRRSSALALASGPLGSLLLSSSNFHRCLPLPEHRAVFALRCCAPSQI